MSRVCPTVIVSPTALLRKQLSGGLPSSAFRVIASKGSPSELSLEDIPHSEMYLLVIECVDTAQTLIAEVALIKRWNALARVALLGSHYQANEIAKAFHAGANAYFADAAISEDLLVAIQLIAGEQTSTRRSAAQSAA